LFSYTFASVDSEAFAIDEIVDDAVVLRAGEQCIAGLLLALESKNASKCWHDR
jgi:hypothetical protein